ncbi:MAG: apolipoprotein N-acyltransferase [Ignavibacteria bacterium]|nr:apolipoprotein N-acyltransferase [Ignavibacteria bacterium]
MKKSKFLLGLLSGVFLALSYPPYPFFLFSFVAFLPILSVFNQVKRKWLLVYLTFFIYHYATNWWISSWQKDTDPYLFVSGFAVAFVHPLLFMFPFAVLHLVSNKVGWNKAIAMFPFIWVAFEWLHSLGDLAYPWLTIGYTQTYNHLWIQISDIGGVWFVSFLILTINVLIYFGIEHYKKHSNDKIILLLKNKYSIAVVVLLILPYLYGFVRVNEFNFQKLIKNFDIVRVGIIQPNINPWRKWEADAATQVRIHLKVQDSLYKVVPNIDMFVWSETAITLFDLDVNAKHNFEIFHSFIPKDVGLLTGFADFRFLGQNEKPSFTTKYFFGDSTLAYETYNSILLLNPDRTFEIYHKNRLTPFGEHIPYSQILGFAKSFLEWNVGISSWAKGREQNILELRTSKKRCKIAPIICIESIYPDYCRTFVKNGAELLVIITNDGWYDYTFGPLQHYLIATVRAIETRRFVVRCANTGISGIIDPTGSTLYRAPQYQQIGIAGDISKLNYTTIYTILGDFIPYISTGITFLLLLFTLFKRKRNNNP